ncbi:uncharacterized protein LOC109726970 [Ananas comosus]|uniref:Uncharacterized protein LOC109726970 n=1 Tax=Ananas comosus TaxID=4615 RepID=A0A6P5H3V7_ANACO|nr:uncharacterized protein LOC109726970 [Ananas comosus]
MATDSQAGSSGGFLGRSLLLLSFRRNQVASMDTIDPPPNNISNSHHEHHDSELGDRFQSHVARRLRSLLPSHSDSDSDSAAGAPLLSLRFLSKLLDVLVSCDREFCHLLLLLLNPSSASSLSSKPAAEFLDRSVRALDLCNAASAALLSLRHWRRQADVAASAAALRRRRALRRALGKLFAAAADSPGSGGRSASARFLSKNWSGGAAAAAAAPGGVAAAAGTMSCLLAFAAWALAAAVPFLDRPAAPPPLPPRQTQWAAAMAALQERIAEESSQRRRAGFGVLAEVRAVETRARCLTELLDKEGAPAAEEDELSAKAAELAEACRALEEGTEPLERQVRAVFHRVAATRAEVIRCLDRSSRCSAPTATASAAAASSSSSSPSPSSSYSF